MYGPTGILPISGQQFGQNGQAWAGVWSFLYYFEAEWTLGSSGFGFLIPCYFLLLNTFLLALCPQFAVVIPEIKLHAINSFKIRMLFRTKFEHCRCLWFKLPVTTAASVSHPKWRKLPLSFQAFEISTLSLTQWLNEDLVMVKINTVILLSRRKREILREFSQISYFCVQNLLICWIIWTC